MADLETRLERCFSSVFPKLSPAELRQASVETVPSWDSLAAVTLVAVIQEEFSLEIDLEELPNLVSFQSVKNYLERNSAGASQSPASR